MSHAVIHQIIITRCYNPVGKENGHLIIKTVDSVSPDEGSMDVGVRFQ